MASEERLRLLTEAMPQIVWTASPHGICDYFNRQFFKYTGLLEDEPPGFGWNLIVYPDDRKCVVTQSVEALEKRPYDLEYRLLGADGVYRWFKVRAVAIRDEAEQILQWVGTCTDIDDQKRAEKACARARRCWNLGCVTEPPNWRTQPRRYGFRQRSWKPLATRHWPPPRQRRRSSPT